MEIQEFLKALGGSLESKATLLSVSWRTIERWERGEGKPSRLAMREIKRFIEEAKRA